MAHAKLSPSGAHRWMRCPGSVVLEAAYPDESSSYAREGTAAHELASLVLNDPETIAQGYVGRTIEFDDHGELVSWTVTQDMADHVDDYVKLVRERAAGKTLLVERKLPIGHITGEKDATGTSDAVIIDYDQEAIEVIDLKYGMGVQVFAENNEQTQLYGLGALHAYGLISDFSYVTMVIHQPRLNHVAEWSIPIHEIEAFADKAREAAHDVELAAERYGDSTIDWDYSFLHPGEKQCQFCKAKATCPALRGAVTEIVGGSAVATAAEFASMAAEAPGSNTSDNYLSVAMSKVGMVEDWCKAVRAEVERRLLAGKEVDGFKLVTGKRGARRWADESAAEKLLKSFRLKQTEMYDLSLISPTKAEKILTSARWAKVQQHIVQSGGKPSVAPATDKRPALAVSNIADDFRDLVNCDTGEN